MSTLTRSYQYAVEHQAEIVAALGRHLVLVAVALVIALALALPLGFWSARSRVAAAVFINGFNTLRVIPSLAILFLALPYFGLSFTSAAIALTILALPPILLNTDIAFRTINAALREAALGMGMTRRQMLWRVEVPVALPVIIAGIRTATVEVIASAALASFIGYRGLGLFITRGFAFYDNAILLVGAIPVALLAIIAEVGMSALQRAVQPPA